MCGRYTSTSTPAGLAEHFEVAQITEEMKAEPLDPSWNVAPTQSVYAVAERRGVRQLGTFRWGLIPSWTRDPASASLLINARAEGVAEKPAYRAALARRRCILPADAFYEWRLIGGRKTKQPYAIAHADGTPMAFAGLWEVWRAPGAAADQLLRSCAIVTTEANELIRPLHNRMPVVLPRAAWSEWLDRDNDDVVGLSRLLVPAPAADFAVWPVGTRVNRADANGPDLLEPVPEPDEEAPVLFPVPNRYDS